MCMATSPRPSRDEDAELRRLTFFEQLGSRLSPAVKAVKDEIRARDRRAEVRAPEDAVEVVKAPDVVLMRVRAGRP